MGGMRISGGAIAALCLLATFLTSTFATECVTHDQLMGINGESFYWPKCDPSSSKSISGPGGYVFGYYCTQEWVDNLNEVLEYLGYCNDGLTIRKFLAQIAYESGFYSTLNQPLDDGAGLIHMIPANFNINVNDMEEVFPGQGIKAAFQAASDKQAFFKDPNYAWKSAAAWYKRTNRVVRNCGLDLFPARYDEQTRCILSIVVDRSEEYNLVSKHIPCTGACNHNVDDSSPTPPTPPPTPPTPPPPSPNVGGGSTRCGTSWSNANNGCGASCSVDGDCPGSERCWADLTKDCAPPPTPPPPPPPSSTRCGTSWSNANNNCGVSCSLDGDCPGSERCWADLTNDCAPPPPPPPPSNTRCGTTWAHANYNCGSSCSLDGDCPGSERCWADLGRCFVTEPIIFNPTPSPSPSPIPSPTPSTTLSSPPFPTPSSTPSSPPFPTPFPTPSSTPSPPFPTPFPTPIEDDESGGDYYWTAVLCFVSEEACDYVELLASLTTISGASVTPSLSQSLDTCDSFENFCDDYGLWTYDKKRQQQQQHSIMVTSTGFVSQEEADSSLARVLEAVGEEGSIDEVGGVKGVECGGDECLNQCQDCAMEGVWHRVETKDVAVRTVVEFRGEEVNGVAEEVLVKQYWGFEGGRCVGSWEGSSRFYSNDFSCDARVTLVGEGDCEMTCDEGVGEEERKVVCERENVPMGNDISSVTFSKSCSVMRFGDEYWRRGEGSVPFDDDDDDSAGEMRSVSLGVVMVVLGMLVVGWF